MVSTLAEVNLHYDTGKLSVPFWYFTCLASSLFDLSSSTIAVSSLLMASRTRSLIASAISMENLFVSANRPITDTASYPASSFLQLTSPDVSNRKQTMTSMAERIVSIDTVSSSSSELASAAALSSRTFCRNASWPDEVVPESGRSVVHKELQVAGTAQSTSLDDGGVRMSGSVVQSSFHHHQAYFKER